MAQTAAPQTSVRLTSCSVEIGRIADLADDADSSGVLNRLSHLVQTEPARLYGLELTRYYPPETLLPDRPDERRQQIIRIMATARDSLVFLPVVLTWIFLSRAFGKPVPEGRSFLEVWTVELTMTAIAVSAAVLLVIAMTIGLHIGEARAEQRASRAALRDRLARVLAKTSLSLTEEARHLAPVPAEDIQRLGYVMGNSIAELKDQLIRTGDQLRMSLDTGPGSKLAEALEGWSSAAHEFSAIAPTLAAPAQTLDHFVRIRQSLTDENLRMMNALGALVTQMQHSTTTIGEEAQAHHGVAGRVYELTVEVGHVLDEFVEQARLLRQATDQVYDMLVHHVGAFAPPPAAAAGQPWAGGSAPSWSWTGDSPPRQREPDEREREPDEREEGPDEENPFGPDPGRSGP
jgi:hypothetical protein